MQIFGAHVNTWSERMLKAGWVLRKVETDRWKAISPENAAFLWEHNTWSPSEADMLRELDKTEAAIARHLYSPYLGTSRLTDPESAPKGGILLPWLLRSHRIHDQNILRMRVASDPAGDEALYAGGARRVETLLQPWPATSGSTRDVHFHVVLCEHVADVLPKSDRIRVLKQLITHLNPQGEIYFSFYEISALPDAKSRENESDGYVFSRGHHRVFLKPYLPGQAISELTRTLGGFAEQVHLQFDEFICRWRPDA